MPERMMCSGWAPSNPFKTQTQVLQRCVCVCVWQRCCKRRHITQRVTTVSRLEKVKQPQESVHEGARDRDRSLAGLQRAVRGEEGRSEVRRDGLQGVFRCTVDVHVLERRTHQCQTTFGVNTHTFTTSSAVVITSMSCDVVCLCLHLW